MPCESVSYRLAEAAMLTLELCSSKRHEDGSAICIFCGHMRCRCPSRGWQTLWHVICCNMAAVERKAGKLRQSVFNDIWSRFPSLQKGRGAVTVCEPPPTRSTDRWRLSSFPPPPPLPVLPGRAAHPAPRNICAASRRKSWISYKSQLGDLAYFPRGFLLSCWTFCFDRQAWIECLCKRGHTVTSSAGLNFCWRKTHRKGYEHLGYFLSAEGAASCLTWCKLLAFSHCCWKANYLFQ